MKIEHGLVKGEVALFFTPAFGAAFDANRIGWRPESTVPVKLCWWWSPRMIIK